LTPDQIAMYLINVNIPFEVVNTVSDYWEYEGDDSTYENEEYSTYNVSGYPEDNESCSNSTSDNYNGEGSINIVVRYVLPLDAAINTTIPMSKLIAVSVQEEGYTSNEYTYQVSSSDEDNNYQYSNTTEVRNEWSRYVERVPGTDWSQALISNSSVTTVTITDGTVPEDYNYEGEDPEDPEYPPGEPEYTEDYEKVTQLYYNTTTQNFTDQGKDYNITSTVTTTISVVETIYDEYENGTTTTTTISVTTTSVEFSKELATKYNDFSDDTPSIKIKSANDVVFDVDLEDPQPLFEINIL